MHGDKQRTTHSGVCVRGSVWSEDELDYYGILLNVIELQYGFDHLVLSKCHWFDTTRGLRVVHPHGLVEVKHASTLASSDVFILVSQANKCITCHTHQRTETDNNGG